MGWRGRGSVVFVSGLGLGMGRWMECDVRWGKRAFFVVGIPVFSLFCYLCAAALLWLNVVF